MIFEYDPWMIGHILTPPVNEASPAERIVTLSAILPTLPSSNDRGPFGIRSMWSPHYQYFFFKGADDFSKFLSTEIYTESVDKVREKFGVCKFLESVYPAISDAFGSHNGQSKPTKSFNSVYSVIFRESGYEIQSNNDDIEMQAICHMSDYIGWPAFIEEDDSGNENYLIHLPKTIESKVDAEQGASLDR